MYHLIIGTCAILTVAAIYRRNPPSPNFWKSALIGAAAMLGLWIVLIVIGSTT